MNLLQVLLMSDVTQKRKYILRFRVVDRDTFLNIKTGKKTIETRAASFRYADIKAGDIVVLVCGKERFEKKVKRGRMFKSISSLTRIYPIKKIMPGFSSEKELTAAYYSYPGYKEKIKKYGLIALEL